MLKITNAIGKTKRDRLSIQIATSCGVIVVQPFPFTLLVWPSIWIVTLEASVIARSTSVVEMMGRVALLGLFWGMDWRGR